MHRFPFQWNSRWKTNICGPHLHKSHRGDLGAVSPGTCRLLSNWKEGKSGENWWPVASIFGRNFSFFSLCAAWQRGNAAFRPQKKTKTNFSAASIGWESVGAMQHFTSLVCLQCRSSGTTFTDLNFPRCATLPRSFYLNILLLGCYLIKINCFYINR